MLQTTPAPPKLRPATRDELTQSLSFALRFNGRKRVHNADEIMANITAQRLVEHLERSGCIVLCKLPAPNHSTRAHPPPIDGSGGGEQQRRQLDGSSGNAASASSQWWDVSAYQPGALICSSISRLSTPPHQPGACSSM
jgi:hypothetical protein